MKDRKGVEIYPGDIVRCYENLICEHGDKDVDFRMVGIARVLGWKNIGWEMILAVEINTHKEDLYFSNQVEKDSLLSLCLSPSHNM